MSIRANGDLDNQISMLLPTLPVEIVNPVMALREVHQRLADLKHSKEAEAATMVTALSGHEPFAFTTLAIQLVSRLPQRNIVTVTTNVPGPPTQLAMLGRPVLEVLPYVPIALRLRTGVAVLSYRDQMTFGVTADFDSNPDVALFATAIEGASPSSPPPR